MLQGAVSTALPQFWQQLSEPEACRNSPTAATASASFST